MRRFALTYLLSLCPKTRPTARFPALGASSFSHPDATARKGAWKARDEGKGSSVRKRDVDETKSRRRFRSSLVVVDRPSSLVDRPSSLATTSRRCFFRRAPPVPPRSSLSHHNPGPPSETNKTIQPRPSRGARAPPRSPAPPPPPPPPQTAASASSAPRSPPPRASPAASRRSSSPTRAASTRPSSSRGSRRPTAARS